jgi:phosphate:Na+ symporter
MNNVSVTVWAGLGLFFVGLRLISAHMRQLGGSGFYSILVSALGRPLAPQSVGLLFGALTQSTGEVTFVTSGLVA